MSAAPSLSLTSSLEDFSTFLHDTCGIEENDHSSMAFTRRTAMSFTQLLCLVDPGEGGGGLCR